MSEDWREKLRKLHDKLLTDGVVSAESHNTKNAITPPRATQGARRSPDVTVPAIDAVLGIDFGTRFTKVAVSLPHINRRVVLGLGDKSDRVVPSRIVLGENERLYSTTLHARYETKNGYRIFEKQASEPGGGSVWRFVSCGKYSARPDHKGGQRLLLG